MWVKHGKRQTIIFVDSKGLEHSKGLDDEKIQLKEGIKQLEEDLGNEDITLESFILSQTPYEKLIEDSIQPSSKDDYSNRHVLFLDERNWPEKLMQEVGLTS